MIECGESTGSRSSVSLSSAIGLSNKQIYYWRELIEYELQG
jgi:hypothetical protein